MSDNRYTVYDDLAWFYNHYMARRFLDEVTPAMGKLFLPIMPKGAHILDVGCGNGQLAQDLTDAGYLVTGIDSSEEMLVYARQNAPSSTFIIADARDFTLDKQFDAAISTCDGLNHVLNITELEQAFGNINKVLKPGGIFYFDLNSWDNYLKYWGTGSSGKVREDSALIANIYFDENTQIGRLTFTMFRRQGELWKKSAVTLESKYHSEEDVTSALKQAGFSTVDIFNDDHNMGWPKMARTFYLARK